MNLGRRAVNETEIIKRCYLPLLSVNPRSNKVAVGWNGEEERDEMAYLPLPPSSTVEWLQEREKERGGRRGKEEKRKRESGGFLDDFLITRSQSRVSARHKRHFARTVGRQLARETRGWHGDACRNDPGFMLSLVGESRGTRTVYTCMRKPDWRKRAKGTWRSFQPIYIRGGRKPSFGGSARILTSLSS